MPTTKHTTAINITGLRIGLLTAIRPTEERRQRQVVWECKCDCGNFYYARAGRLRTQEVQSCGCQEGHATHRLSKTRACRAILHAILRCEQADNPNFHNYGGRGIRVCQGWHDVTSFCKDMGEPRKGESLDRIENNGHYSCGKCPECLENGWPMNCRWTNMQVQSRNRRDNHHLTANGKTMLLVEWIAETRIPKNTILNRLNRGWSEHRALTTPSPSSLRTD